MKIQLSEREIEFPNKIYLDQLIKVDLSMIDKLDSIMQSQDLNESKKGIIWLMEFFKAIDITERFTLDDLYITIQNGSLMNWFKTVFGGFRKSS